MTMGLFLKIKEWMKNDCHLINLTHYAVRYARFVVANKLKLCITRALFTRVSPTSFPGPLTDTTI